MLERVVDEDNPESMWLCPRCEIWVGWKLNSCREGHDRPRIPVRVEDVEEEISWRVSRWDRYRVKARKLGGWSR